MGPLAPPKKVVNFPVPTRGTVTTIVARKPECCQICKEPAVFFVSSVRDGQAGYYCPQCFSKHGIGIGYGLAQVIIDGSCEVNVRDDEIDVISSDTILKIQLQRR